MSSEPAIVVERLGKCYRIGRPRKKPAGLAGRAAALLAAPFRHLATSLRRPDEDELLWAVRDVTLTVPRGEVLGIVGPNGSGKSTLLRVLSRITEPSEGTARLRGRVGSLVGVGTGFHPELTGRENVYLNGAVLGMRQQEVSRRFDEIVDFSGVSAFLDTPVKRYSSGMKVRLGFAVAAHLDPDILLVDEVLAVGDAAFKTKCVRKLRQTAESGRTVVAVSHQLETIVGLSSRVLWLERGRVRQIGEPQEVVGAYLAGQGTGEVVDLEEGAERRPGTGQLRIVRLEVCDAGGAPVEYVSSGQDVVLRLHYHAAEGPRDVEPCIVVRSALGGRLICFYTGLSGRPFGRLPAEGVLECHVPRLPLGPGSYQLAASATVRGERADVVEHAGSLEVVAGDFFGSHSLGKAGIVLCDHSWRAEA